MSSGQQPLTAQATRLKLRTAIGRYGQTAALRDGRTVPDRAVLDHVEVEPIGNAFPVMCRDLAFDVSEMSITAYLTARVYGKGFTALPVFPLPVFPQPHAALAVATASGVTRPKELEGKAVVERAYARTVGLWVRGLLMHDYGVDINTVTWVGVEEEHVPEYAPDAPPNVRPRFGAGMAELLLGGEVAAGIAVGAREGIAPLIPDARSAAIDYYRRTGIYQINHTVVVKDTLLQAHPWLGRSLYRAFAAAKQAWLDGGPDTSPAIELGLPGNDPLPYGIDANRASLEALVRFAHEQRVTPRRYSVEDLFPLAVE